jgi:hypothetical protein
MVNSTSQLFVIDAWYFDVNVNPIQKWTRDSFLVFGHKRMRTSARLLGVPIKSTRTGVDTIEHVFMFSRP